MIELFKITPTQLANDLFLDNDYKFNPIVIWNRLIPVDGATTISDVRRSLQEKAHEN